ncbi:hypothetical protein OXIME_000768 [Oxyplasma meridianum]|uniref:Uncharacterized protein n=1 Tax=Oxyplasma meridianum TaxID=3073602 RepID=A0AAX4NFU5_9ARCH
MKALKIKNVSPSHISPLTSDLDVNILIYLRDPERSMESYMKFIYIDATYFNVNMGKNTEKKDLYLYALV